MMINILNIIEECKHGSPDGEAFRLLVRSGRAAHGGLYRGVDILLGISLLVWPTKAVCAYMA
jgi:hypothetical protein